jgi:hypothetical protein
LETLGHFGDMAANKLELNGTSSLIDSKLIVVISGKFMKCILRISMKAANKL